MNIEILQELKARLSNVKTTLAVKEAKAEELKAELKERYNLTVEQIPERKKIIDQELEESELKIEELAKSIEVLLLEYEAV